MILRGRSNRVGVYCVSDQYTKENFMEITMVLSVTKFEFRNPEKNPVKDFIENVDFRGRNLSEIFFRVYTSDLIFDPLSDGIGHFLLQ